MATMHHLLTGVYDEQRMAATYCSDHCRDAAKMTKKREKMANPIVITPEVAEVASIPA